MEVKGEALLQRPMGNTVKTAQWADKWQWPVTEDHGGSEDSWKFLGNKKDTVDMW